MFLGLVLTGAIAYLLTGNPEVATSVLYFFREHRVLAVGVALLQFGISVAAISTLQSGRTSPLVGKVLFLVYSSLMGVTMSVPVMFYPGWSVGMAFGISAALFGIFAVMGYTTTRNLQSRGVSLAISMGVVGVILVNIVQIFVGLGIVELIVCYAMVILGCVCVAKELQRLRMMASDVAAQGEKAVERQGVLGALLLYVYFVMIFQSVLRILNFSDDR